ncbi:ABC transporter permease [Robertmurraya korlensis]|uniref:ABC transporter permease n=1 Tax=Robertmurraya korlensis TaxID=519977 RepID=UPI0020420C81|nr:ABC transporter permease [Robertmurraya korlensis]MCM3601358.1 ABC transporter permease [Robertmurraya korlensis]
MKKIYLYSTLLFISLLILWETIVKVKKISPLILPKPTTIAENLFTSLLSGYFTPHIFTTLVEIISGFFVGALIGIGLGLLVAQSNTLQLILRPYIIATQAMPKVALAPLLILWFGYGYTPKILIVALISFFPLFESTITGLLVVDKDRLALFQLLKASKWQTLWRLQLPTAIPYLLSGTRVAVVLSVVGAVVSEFIGANKGLGALIIVAQGMMDTPLLFSAFILLTSIGILLYASIYAIEHLFLRKYTSYRRKNS